LLGVRQMMPALATSNRLATSVLHLAPCQYQRRTAKV
jgi:hypothetical protein